MIEVNVDFCDMIIIIDGKKESFDDYGVYTDFGRGGIISNPWNMDEFQEWGFVEFLEEKLGTDFEIDYKYNYIREVIER